MFFHTIATHKNVHFEELLAVWLLVVFGEELYPGINKAEIVFWDGLPEGKTAIELEAEGYKLVGIGGGRHDEHPSENGPRKEGECAASLLAKDLGVRDDPSLKKILDFAISRDLELGKSEFEIPAVVKTLYEGGWDSMSVLQWVFTALQAVYEGQLKFFGNARQDFANATIIDAEIGHGKKAKLAVAVSDSPKFAAYARSAHGCHAGIVIQQNAMGNVIIQTNNWLHINLVDTVRMLRIEELKLAGKPIPRDWKVLGGEKNVEPCWYMHQNREMLLNGSSTTSAPPTKIPLAKISELVQIGINPNAFEPTRAAQCKQGICTSSPKNTCPWYQYGLGRCTKIRFETAQRANTPQTQTA